ncbi:MAG TPA: 6-carboxytetrahydropterin synthase [Gemmatimonadales bacterium]|nr:6-carboxytetrahydropterin synthase [Gemmatimonadales bacterium]
MPSCVVARRLHFNAAHRLHNPAKSDAWNRETFGLCNNPNYHGHNYELEVLVEGEIDPATGYVVDIGRLKTLVEERVLRHLDHKNLNLDVPWFRDLLPSAENIAVVIWQQLQPEIPAGRLLRIRLWETPRNYVEYEGR